MLTPMNEADCVRAGTKGSYCRGCQQGFSSPWGFDKHRSDGRCLNPADVGLVIGKRGYWTRPFDGVEQ